MKNRLFLASLLIGSMVLGSATLFAQNPTEHGKPAPDDAEPQMAGLHMARGQAGPPNGAGGVKLLQWFGGQVQHTTTVFPIFWGTKWSDSTFKGDKVDGIQSFYSSVGDSSYAKTNTEYYDGSGHVSSTINLGATFIDATQAASSGGSTSTILAEVCKVYPSPEAGAYYPVYVDSPRGSAGYCAWHSAGTCNGRAIQFAFFFNLDGDPGCDPGKTGSYDKVHGNSQGLSALANVTGHELSEMLTDPKLTAWYDRQGAENADKCAWTFGKNPVAFSNGSTWRIQGNWSNNAYTASAGYVDISSNTKTRGCIDGTN